MALTPTDEQMHVLEQFLTGDDLVIEAAAGAGKTSSLGLLAARGGIDSGLYIAFNRAIADEAQLKFRGTGITARTGHALAYRDFGAPRRERFDVPYKPMREAARDFGAEPYFFSPSDRASQHRLGGSDVLRLAQNAVTAFCNSAADTIGPEHVTLPIALSIGDSRGEQRLREAIAAVGREIWSDVASIDGTSRVGHDHYLKLFQLSRPHLDVDVIFLDEAQDSNPVLLSILRQQEHAQKVFVGDRAQAIYCQPAGTMVAVREPSQGSAAPELRCGVEWCARRRQHRETGMCDQHEHERRAGREPRFIGHRRLGTLTQVPIESLQPGDLVSTYSNGTVYQTGRPIEHVTVLDHDGDLVVATHESGRVSEYTPNHHCIVRLAPRDQQRHVVYLMRRGTRYRVGRTKLLIGSQTNRFGVAMRGKQEGADAAWVIGAYDSPLDAAVAESLTQVKYGVPSMCFEAGNQTRPQHVERFWDQVGDTSSGAHRLLSDKGLLHDFPLWQRGVPLGVKSEFVTAAANIFDGMLMLSADDAIERRKSKGAATVAPHHVWRPIRVSRRHYTGKVYSLEVAQHHNYFADGLLTHNSFRGAIDSMGTFPGARRARLTKSFRFGQPVADEANQWLAMLGLDMRINGNEDVDSQLGRVRDADVVLVRSNGGAIGELLDAQVRGKRVSLGSKARADQIKKLAQAAEDLQKRGWTSHPEFMLFKTWSQVQDHAETEEGASIAPLVKVVDKHGAREVVRAIDACVEMERADVTIATAHTGKGLEWSRVRIGEDFPQPYRDEDGDLVIPDAEEQRLAYVAVTRAQHVLDRGSLAWIDEHAPAMATPTA